MVCDWRGSGVLQKEHLAPIILDTFQTSWSHEVRRRQIEASRWAGVGLCWKPKAQELRSVSRRFVDRSRENWRPLKNAQTLLDTPFQCLNWVTTIRRHSFVRRINHKIMIIVSPAKRIHKLKPRIELSVSVNLWIKVTRIDVDTVVKVSGPLRWYRGISGRSLYDWLINLTYTFECCSL